MEVTTINRRLGIERIREAISIRIELGDAREPIWDSVAVGIEKSRVGVSTEDVFHRSARTKRAWRREHRVELVRVKHGAHGRALHAEVHVKRGNGVADVEIADVHRVGLAKRDDHLVGHGARTGQPGDAGGLGLGPVDGVANTVRLDNRKAAAWRCVHVAVQPRHDYRPAGAHIAAKVAALVPESIERLQIVAIARDHDESVHKDVQLVAAAPQQRHRILSYQP